MKYQIVIAGIGGQGAVFLVKVLSIASALANQKCLGTENHGMSQRGGSVSCYVKIGDFYAPAIDEGQADLLIALEGNEALRNIQYLKTENSTIIVNANQQFPKLAFKTFSIDAFSKAKNKEFPIEALNVYMLGVCIAKDAHFPFSLEQIEQAITQMNPKVAEKNIAVLHLGVNDSRSIA
ncbi:MAG: 2-oxoacid:acceptor oxidoreductase family protein [Sulfurospirillaceae bacterium]|nr:2-oxoacid:acceptor oxidoreductase family protein [Sulfurospirillaceae bacterium]